MPSFVTNSFVANPGIDNPTNLLASMSSATLDVVIRQLGSSVTSASSGMSARDLNYNSITPVVGTLVTLSAQDGTVFQCDQIYHNSQFAIGYGQHLTSLFTVNTAASAALVLTENTYDTFTVNRRRKWYGLQG